MTDKTSKRPPSPLKRITTKSWQRSLALVNLTVSSTAKIAGHKISSLWLGDEQKEARLRELLGQQAVQLVQELGRLKGSIMKAGQMIAIYGEHFLPPEVNEILKSLNADSQPVAWDQMHAVLRKQLGDRLDELDVDPQSIAAASMGQVYRATIKATGEVIAIKVQYPGVEQAIGSDLKALYRIVRLLQVSSHSGSFEDIFKEVRMMLHYEVDYQRELATAQKFREYLADDPRFVIPRVFPEYSTKRILAMSYEDGFAVDSVEVAKLSQDARNRIGAAVMELMFREIFQWRQVQTDPHFGNYKIRLDGEAWRIVLLDFGAVRQFPKRYIVPFAGVVHGSLLRDPDAIARAAVDLGFLRESDNAQTRDLFAKICLTAIEGFGSEFESPSLDGSDPGPNPYRWGQGDLLHKLTDLAKDAIFTFKLRPPPREAVFLDRKMVGTYTLLCRLGLQMGPRRLLLKYLDEHIDK